MLRHRLFHRLLAPRAANCTDASGHISFRQIRFGAEQQWDQVCDPPKMRNFHAWSDSKTQERESDSKQANKLRRLFSTSCTCTSPSCESGAGSWAACAWNRQPGRQLSSAGYSTRQRIWPPGKWRTRTPDLKTHLVATRSKENQNVRLQVLSK